MYEVRWRVLRERVGGTLARIEQAHSDEECFRLAALALALLDRHKVDDKGRCRVWGCSRWRCMPWGKRRTCQVFVMVHFWVEQPLQILGPDRYVNNTAAIRL